MAFDLEEGCSYDDNWTKTVGSQMDNWEGRKRELLRRGRFVCGFDEDVPKGSARLCRCSRVLLKVVLDDWYERVRVMTDKGAGTKLVEEYDALGVAVPTVLWDDEGRMQ